MNCFSNLFDRVLYMCGPGSSVGIATELRAGWSGIESRWGRDFPPVQTGHGAHPISCTMGTGSFPGVKCGRGVLLTTHPLLVPRSWKSTAIPLLTLRAFVAYKMGGKLPTSTCFAQVHCPSSGVSQHCIHAMGFVMLVLLASEFHPDHAS